MEAQVKELAETVKAHTYRLGKHSDRILLLEAGSKPMLDSLDRLEVYTGKIKSTLDTYVAESTNKREKLSLWVIRGLTLLVISLIGYIFLNH